MFLNDGNVENMYNINCSICFGFGFVVFESMLKMLKIIVEKIDR